MAKQKALPGSELLPTVGEPGTYEWCEEVVECMNAAWRSHEQADRAFLAAVNAAVQYKIWDILSPPFPEEPYRSLEGLIRHEADPGQAENMQIAIRFSGVLERAAEQEAAEQAAGSSARAASLAADGGQLGQARVNLPVDRQMAEDAQAALGNALLDQFESQIAAMGLDPAAVAAAAAGQDPAVLLPSGDQGAEPAAPRRSAAQRKRDKLERTRPELAEAVDAGELTLKQAYVQAGIEKEVRMLDKLQRLWRNASDEERDRFLSWLDEQEHQAERAEYEQDVYGEE